MQRKKEFDVNSIPNIITFFYLELLIVAILTTHTILATTYSVLTAIHNSETS